GPDPVPLPEGFGPSDFTRAFEKILKSFEAASSGGKPDAPPSSALIEERMLESFAAPPFLRLLFDSICRSKDGNSIF
ncbi:MAG: hypothetical protein ACLFRY_05915, partial [Spirochaetia bacterium]